MLQPINGIKRLPRIGQVASALVRIFASIERTPREGEACADLGHEKVESRAIEITCVHCFIIHKNGTIVAIGDSVLCQTTARIRVHLA
jgi:hypothetical protein